MRFDETLSPAYGREYKSRLGIWSDLMDNKDFVCNPGRKGTYVNLPQLIELKVTEFNVRYSRMTKITVFKIKDGRLIK
jgi:hypothetical protein